MPTAAGSYTTVENIVGMFPTFKRGIAQQNPPDSLIVTYAVDVQGDVDAILQRRFGEAISAPPYSGSFTAWTAAFGTDQLACLEKIVRYGAAAQLCQTLASFGVAGARDLAKQFDEEYEELRNQLDARDMRTGRPLTSGLYDHLFDSLSRTETSRPGLEAIAGGDQPKGETPMEEGLSNVFGKFDRRGT